MRQPSSSPESPREGEGIEPLVPQPYSSLGSKNPMKYEARNRNSSRRNWCFESSSLQQTVRVSPRLGHYRSKNPRFRADMRGCGRQRYSVLVEIEQTGAVISVGLYSSTALPLMASGNGGRGLGQAPARFDVLKQSRAGRVVPARPAADVSERAACLRSNPVAAGRREWLA
jgi:hypothetical protein